MILQPLYLRSVYHATSLRPKRMLIFSVLLVGLTILVFVHLDFYSVEMRTMTPRSKSQDLYKFDSASSLVSYQIKNRAPILDKMFWKQSLERASDFDPMRHQKPVADLNIMSVYDTLKFPDIADPKQWSLKTGLTESNLLKLQKLEPKTWSKENKLKVFVILHSHNDAGWFRTFEGYYIKKTKHILDNILHYLSNNKDLKFIWAEMSFFSLWWKDLPSKQRIAVKKLLDTKQLEFVAGGWVMPDEANVHYLSYFTQLIEGHQFLQQHFNVSPRNGWAIDPFGLSTSLNFLQTRAGINNTVFMRTHYILKHFLRENKATEFMWRQLWDSEGTGDIFSYLMPYGSYDHTITCGPNSKVCSSIFQDPQTSILPNKLATISLKLLEQLRSKSMLFNTNNLMYPVGGDFHWASVSEWTVDLAILRNVMEYINSRDELYTEIKFATLDEYFNAVRSEIRNGTFQPKSLVGDFFTYSDSNLDYWSGYFTSRVFHKATERKLMTSLRTAQLLFTLMTAEVSKHWGTLSFKFIAYLLQKLIQSRRNLSIFQHHDGITGTSTDYVVKDYSKKMKTAMDGCQEVTMTSLFVLSSLEYFKNGNFTLENTSNYNSTYAPAIYQNGSDRNIWRPFIFQFDAAAENNSTSRSKIVTVFNPLETPHSKLITIGVSSPSVKVATLDDKDIRSEIHPVLVHSDSRLRSAEAFELNFVAQLKPLEIRHYKIISYIHQDAPEKTVDIQVLNANTDFSSIFRNTFTIASSKDADVLKLSNEYFSVSFSSNGTAKSIQRKDTGENRLFKISFKYYKSGKRSGLYSFFPEGSAEPLNFKNPVITIVRGTFKSYVEVWLPNVKHRLTLYNHKGIDSSALEITNTIDIRKEVDYELLMHIGTDIASGDTFYTDSNGFQMMQRKHRSNLPIQGNYYPVASSAFIEDLDLRMTILAAQPGGGTSLKSGELEIMQDRINFHDDGHGIGQGGKDNLMTVSKYMVIFEKILEKDNLNSFPTLSLASHRQLHNLLHPVQAFVKTAVAPEDLLPLRYALSVENSNMVSCDVLLMTSHILPEYKASTEANDASIFVHTGDKIGLLFHRVGFDRRFSDESLGDICNKSETNLGRLNIRNMFSCLFEQRLHQTTVSFSKVIGNLEDFQQFIMNPMEVYGFTARFRNFTGDPWNPLTLLDLPS